MKRNLLSTIILLFAASSIFGQRYLNEVFTSYQKVKDSVYATNYEVLTGSPVLKGLKCDIYLPPASDTSTSRPLIILLHTGSFLPRYVNQNPTGDKSDSATVEMCKRFAMRGFVVCAPAYRQGWNPTGSTVDIRRGTIMQAVYRGMQDAKAAVRYMRKNAALYGVDTGRIVMGGQGTGGYIALGCAYIDRNPETRYSKFINSTTSLPFIDTAVMGDIDGIIAAPMNNVNNVGFSSRVHMIFNMGGAIGDINWMEAGELPVVGFHSATDPFAPDTSGIVFVPGTSPQPVIPVDGSRNICRMANTLGLNNQWKLASFHDSYSIASKINNENIEGYFRFRVAPGGYQAGPWEWWDSATTIAVANGTLLAIGYTAPQAAAGAQQCHTNGLTTNPNMSKTKALAYIDTMQNYLAPRIMIALKINGYLQFMGIDQARGEAKFGMHPNPTNNHLTITTEEEIQMVQLFDMSGRNVLSGTSADLDFNLTAGVYIVKVTTDKGEAVQKLIVN